MNPLDDFVHNLMARAEFIGKFQRGEWHVGQRTEVRFLHAGFIPARVSSLTRHPDGRIHRITFALDAKGHDARWDDDTGTWEMIPKGPRT